MVPFRSFIGHAAALIVAGSCFAALAEVPWFQIERFPASSVPASAGRSVSANSGVVAIGFPSERFPDDQVGAVRVFRANGVDWGEEALITPADPEFGSFGTSLALDGDTLAVGSPVSAPGRVVVYRQASGSWDTEAVLTIQDTPSVQVGDFGYALALTGDTLVVGAPLTDLGGRTNAGAVYVFTRSAGSWEFQARLIAEDAISGLSLGLSICIAGDVIVAGTRETGLGEAGSAYVFRQTASAGWLQEAKLSASDGVSGDGFGVAVAAAGDTIAVGAPYDINNGLVDTGSVYLFEWDGVTSWVETAKLLASDAADGTQFGYSLSADGDLLAVGARGYGYDGAVYLFQRDMDGWSEIEKLLPSGGVGEQQFFGAAVSLRGSLLAVGAPGDAELGANTGAAYVFSGGDCNQNGVGDETDIAQGVSADVNANGIPDECECIGDLTGDGVVNLDDLSILLANYGAPDALPEDGDINADGHIDLADLSVMLARFGLDCG